MKKDRESAKRRTNLKAYYEQDGITIYCADNREVLPLMPHSDLLLTDPNYGIGESGKRNLTRTNLAKPTDYGDFDWDRKPPADWMFGLMLEKSTKQIIWGGNYFPLPPSACWLVWDKDNSGDFADCELAWTNLPMAVRKFKWRWNGMLQEDMGRKEPRMYPTQKPLALMKWCIGLAGKVETILDPFMGSGTTLRAAKDLGLKAIGIDKSEQACEVAATRLSQGAFSFSTQENVLGDNDLGKARRSLLK